MNASRNVGRAKETKILVIEDDEVDYRAVARMMSGGEQTLTCVWEPEPGGVLQRTESETFDAILLDYRLGGIDGLEILQLLRQSGVESPVILMTGNDDERLEQEALDAGADDYLVKGHFSRRELRRALRYALSRDQSNRDLKLLKSALDHGPVGIAIASVRDGHGEPGITYANPMFQMITGRTAGALRGQPVSLLFGPATDPLRIAQFHRTQESRMDFLEGMVLYRADGSSFQGHLRVGAFAGRSDAVSHFVVVLRDMTDQHRREQQLADQARMLDLAEEAIIAQDLEGRVIYWNRFAAEMFDCPLEKATGRHLSELTRIEDKVLCEARRQTYQNGVWQGEVPMMGADGGKLTVLSRWTLLRDENDEPTGILTINTDVTEKQQMQERFNRTQRMEAIGSLAAGVAHDLNNVLSPILMGASLFDMEENVSPTLQELRHTIEESAHRGAQIVRQLLTFARGSQQEKTLIQTRHLAREIHSLARKTFPPAIKMNLDFPSDLWPVRGNPTQFHQILLNLAVNARDAMPEGGELTMGGANRNLDPASAKELGVPPGPYTTLSVRDTGTGIAPELRERIFELFFTTKPEGEGTGLGLATIKNLVEENNGFIELESEVGCGSIFTVAFPAELEVEVARAPGKDSLPQGHGETVLVVDDEDSIRTVVCRTLECSGYHTLTAKDGAEGLEVFKAHRDEINVVLSDLLMPEMDGPTMVSALRQMRPDLKVLFASGATSRTNAQLASRWREACSDAEYLDKPYRIPELLQRLHSLLDGQTVPG